MANHNIALFFRFENSTWRQLRYVVSIGVDFLLIKQIPRGRNVFVRSLFKLYNSKMHRAGRQTCRLYNSISAWNFGCRHKKVFAANWFYFSPEFLNFVPNSGEYQNKNVFAAFWFDLSPKLRISCCQVGITSQKTEEARHVLPPSVSDPRGRRSLAFSKVTPVVVSNNKNNNRQHLFFPKPIIFKCR